MYLKSKNGKAYGTIVGRAISIILSLYIFLLAINLIGETFSLMGSEYIHQMIAITSNPFVGLLIGLLSTAIIQSSSTVTAVIVVAVGSGAIGLENAVPIIMGANIGTTVTCTLVSFGYLNNEKAFQRATGAASLHGFFNILTAIILLPLELYFDVLSGAASYLSTLIAGQDQIYITPTHFLDYLVNPVWLFLNQDLGASSVVIFLIAIGLVFLSIKWLNLSARSLLLGEDSNKITQFMFENDWKSLLSGTLLTLCIQSSSFTSSLAVAFAATDKISIRSTLSFLVGANVGTTVTALIASMGNSQEALSIALVHCLFNLCGLFIFMVPQVFSLAQRYAARISKLSANRLHGLLYLILIFFIVPFILIWLSTN
ncbi:Na/Pi symporter [Sediminitomix flava]|nr:Na/Pi symporter [Sediminitomix flava]